jgi:hypothetical protein
MRRKSDVEVVLAQFSDMEQPEPEEDFDEDNDEFDQEGDE